MLEKLAEEAKRDDLTILILQLSLKTSEYDVYSFFQKVIITLMHINMMVCRGTAAVSEISELSRILEQGNRKGISSFYQAIHSNPCGL